MVTIRRDLKEIAKRHKDFIDRKPVKRPLYCVNVLGKGYAAMYEKTFSKIPKGIAMKPEDIDMDAYISDVEKFLDWHEEAGFDFFYPVTPYFFIPWIEAIIGCPIFAGKDSFYAEPFLFNWDDMPPKIDLSSKNRWFVKLCEMTEILVDTFGSNYPIASSTHFRGPADMASAAIGQKQYPLELFDNPEKLKKFGSICTDAFIEAARTVNEIASRAGFKGYVVNNYGIYSEKVLQYYQDDAVAFLSPKFYREFIVSDHLRIDKSFASTLYHIHPVSMFVADELVRFPNLKIIEVNREPLAIGPSLEDMLPVFKKIQENGKSLLINWTDIDFTPELLEKEVGLACDYLSYEGLCVYVCAENIEDAYKKTDAVKKIFDL